MAVELDVICVECGIVFGLDLADCKSPSSEPLSSEDTFGKSRLESDSPSEEDSSVVVIFVPSDESHRCHQPLLVLGTVA